jgi:hypothetical protein
MRVQLAGDELLAHAHLAQDQHVGLGRRDAGDQAPQRSHRRGLAQQGRRGLDGSRRRTPVRDGGLDDRDEARVVPGFGDEVEGAELEGLYREIYFGVGCHSDDRWRIGARYGLAQQREALFAVRLARGEVHVQQDYRRPLGIQGGSEFAWSPQHAHGADATLQQ